MYAARVAFRSTNFYAVDITVAELCQFQFPERSGMCLILTVQLGPEDSQMWGAEHQRLLLPQHCLHAPCNKYKVIKIVEHLCVAFLASIQKNASATIEKILGADQRLEGEPYQ